MNKAILRQNSLGVASLAAVFLSALFGSSLAPLLGSLRELHVPLGDQEHGLFRSRVGQFLDQAERLRGQFSPSL